MGGSVFYSKPPVESAPMPPSDQPVARLDHELTVRPCPVGWRVSYGLRFLSSPMRSLVVSLSGLMAAGKGSMGEFLIGFSFQCKVKEMKEFWESEWEYSSLVWICSSTHGQSQVSVIDANNPADVLDSFDVCSSHLLCISAIPGMKVDI